MEDNDVNMEDSSDDIDNNLVHLGHMVTEAEVDKQNRWMR